MCAYKYEHYITPGNKHTQRYDYEWLHNATALLS